jgi:metal-sulfur cluster biosynthetic enzyme
MSASAVDERLVWEALADVRDPELPLSVVDLGLVYHVEVLASTVTVELTLTSMGCPCVDWIIDDVRARVAALAGDREVDVRLVWDPPWTQERISDAGREALAAIGVST